jgi:serine/threonine protein kinase
MPLSTGTVINNRYRIVSLLGQGGMGTVYRAWDLNLKKPVALKENMDDSPEAQKQFSREAAILAHLEHPSLTRVTDYFFAPALDGKTKYGYLVMDYVEGEDLQSMLDRLGALPEAQALSWTAQICDALDFLHSQKPPIIHRDIKPANIKIRPDGKAMLVDFGIAKQYSATMATTLGAKAVTPGFSPPEQYGGGRTDSRSDIYSLGATLYAILTGEVMPESVRRMAGIAPVKPPSQLNPQISTNVEKAILKATDVDADRRFQEVCQFKDALTQTTGEVVASGPVASTVWSAEIDSTLRMPPPSIPRPAPPARVHAPRKQSVPGWVWVVLVLGALFVMWFGFRLAARIRINKQVPPAAVNNPTATHVIAVASNPTPTHSQASNPQHPTATAKPYSPPPTNPPQAQVVPVATQAPSLPSASPPKLTLDQAYNCRGGPASSFELVWTFDAGLVLDIIGKSDSGWWLVRINDPRTRGQQCWISGGTPQGDTSQVPFSNWTGTREQARTPWP